MSEPVALYRDGEKAVVVAPSEVQRMLSEGWSLYPDGFGVAHFVDVEPMADEMFAPITTAPVPARRGRPRKVTG